jgi:hypothetical protein
MKSWIIAASEEAEIIYDCNIVKDFSGSVYWVVQEYQQLE